MSYSVHYKKGNRDANEPALLAVAGKYGYLDFDTICKMNYPPEIVERFYQTRHSKDGHDVIFFDHLGVFCVEIKNLEGRTKTGELEPREETFRDLCKMLGIPWYKVCTEQEMADVIAERLT